MKITKAKLKNRSLEIEYRETRSFVNSDGEMVQSERDIASRCYDICHNSLIEAFDRFKPHAALIADVREALRVEGALSQGVPFEMMDPEDLKTLTITGFVITGSEDDGSQAVMIILTKKTGTRVLNITTPSVKFEDVDSYAYAVELQEVANDCLNEVEEYMEGKVAVKQLEMDFDEGFNTDPSKEGEKAPKKRGRKAKSIEGFTSEVADDGTVIFSQDVA